MTQAANLAALGSNAGTTGILAATGGGTAGTAGVTGFKNRIINGAMNVNQYGSGSNNSVTTVNTYTIDRFAYYATTGAAQFTIQQNAGSVTPPVGFTNYLGFTNSASAYSIVSSSLCCIDHQIEGYNISDLGYGTANAKTCTLSFWVYSSLTGTYSGTIQNSAQSRAYGFTYSIPTANTWTYITAVIPGDTSGSWGTTNGRGIGINWSLGCGTTFNAPSSGSWLTGQYFGVTGTTNWVATANATLYITGVQFEQGVSATNFDVRSYGTELGLCQRYYEYGYALFCCYGNGANGLYGSAPIKVTKRATPTVSASYDSQVNWPSPTLTATDVNSVQVTQAAASSVGFARLGAQWIASSEL